MNGFVENLHQIVYKNAENTSFQLFKLFFRLTFKSSGPDSIDTNFALAIG